MRMHTAHETLGMRLAGCSERSICMTAELWDMKPWLIRSNHEKGVPGFTSVGGLPSYQLIRVEGEVDGLSKSWRHSGSYYRGGHSVHAPTCLAESLECPMHLPPNCTISSLLSFICAALLKSTLLMLGACTFQNGYFLANWKFPLQQLHFYLEGIFFS